MELPSLPRHARIAATLALFAVAVLTAAVPAAGRGTADPAVETEELMAEEVSYRNGDVTVDGTIIAPAATGTGRPGIVLIPGAGEGLPRDSTGPTPKRSPAPASWH